MRAHVAFRCAINGFFFDNPEDDFFKSNARRYHDYLFGSSAGSSGLRLLSDWEYNYPKGIDILAVESRNVFGWVEGFLQEDINDTRVE